MARKIKDPGFGYGSVKNAKSMINKDGSSNVIHVNKKRSLDDLYSFFIEISWAKFFVLILLAYTLMNVVFGLVYTFIGIEEITKRTGNVFSDFLNGFFFSAQTLTTVGYGGIAPHGITSNLIAAFEAMIGLLSFSFITGLLYGRFSKPRAAIKFSENLILREFKGERALMFRLMNSRKTVMIEPKIRVTLSLTEKDETNASVKKYFELKLQRDAIMYLPTVWTVVHEIGESSPLYSYTSEEISKLKAELFLLLQYHEESFAQNVYQIYTYDFKDLEVDVKYKPSYKFDENGYTILNHNTLSEVEKM